MNKWKVKKTTERTYNVRSGEPLDSVTFWVRDENEMPIFLICSGSKNPEEAAQLSAAAPSMFEALEDIRDSLEGGLPDRGGREYTLACNAIAKAKGE